MSSITIIRGRPTFISKKALNDAAALLTASGLVQSHSALSRLSRAFLVLVGYNNKRSVATLSVKQPTRDYVTRLFERAGVVPNGEALEFGYLYAPPGSGAMFNGPRLYREAMEVVQRQGTPFYAVTRADNNTMTRYLSRKLGWFGSLPFKSEVGSHNLILWTATPQRSVVPPRSPIAAKGRRFTNQRVDADGYVRGKIYVGVEHSGKHVNASVAITDTGR